MASGLSLNVQPEPWVRKAFLRACGGVAAGKPQLSSLIAPSAGKGCILPEEARVTHGVCVSTPQAPSHTQRAMEAKEVGFGTDLEARVALLGIVLPL